jgi:putative glutamine amidotransferase
MGNRPKIGITGHISKDSPNLSITNSYMEAVFACGGFPLLLPIKGNEELWLQAAGEMDGFLFTGGGDVSPSRFGEETLQCCGEISPLRDTMELDLLNAILPTGKPVLGVCRGIQLLNVGLGGTLYQDIYLQNAQPFLQQHTQKLPDYLPAHDIIIEEGSLLHRIEKTTRLPVNTLHHQAVKDCAPGVSIAARSSSGLIEAIEKQDHPFFLGVQWHPERMWHVDTAAKVLFESFVDACSKTL